MLRRVQAAEVGPGEAQDKQKTPVWAFAKPTARSKARASYVDVALACRAVVLGGPGRAPRDEHEALELGDQHAVLVEHPRVHLHGAAVGL